MPERNLTRFNGTVALFANGTVVDRSQWSPTPRLQYEGIRGTTNLTVRMNIQATVEVTDESNTTERRSYSLTVTDSKHITVQNLSVVPERQNVGLVAREQGRNKSIVAMTLPGRWHRASFGDGPTVDSKWRFYTEYNESWQSWETAGNESAPPEFTQVAPLEVHAVPLKAGPELTQPFLDSEKNASSGNRRIVRLQYPNSDSEMAPQPPLPSGTNLERANQSTTANTFTLRSSHSLRGLENYTVHGLVRGHSVTRSINTTDPTIIRKPNLTVEDGLEAPNESATVLEIESSGVGGPIRQGQLTVRTDELVLRREVTNLGTNRFVLAESMIPSAEITYEPAVPWWNQSRQVPVQATRIYYTSTVGLPPIDAIIDSIVGALLWIVPLGVLLYGYDVLTRGKLLRWYKP
ncbi:hypothetical protein EGH22_20495 [Halomicroarcula sp. F28]|uniref:hypothetical protein n=1 Tax=Haloarcula salinisoli TaxID=2487746 RepID=UPI001C72FB4E|nr:hypothetical protein [Halomicroarcula salinisoli]MBX0288714.1 hypothetical protein [Halomicroarcula salinisoli]